MSKSTFFCGIGGSGMLPLALIVHSFGARVAGSDRSREQGRTPEKFTWIETQGIELFPQDGSGITDDVQELIVSTAVEDSIPDIAAAKAQGITITHRAALLARLFNAAQTSVAVAGTSGKSTVTGMLAFILHHMALRPTVMNGAVMRDFASHQNPYASALIGHSEYFVSEVDESDGSISLFNPSVAVITNIALDHKSMDELRRLFGDFAGRAGVIIMNADNAETKALAAQHHAILYSDSDHPDLRLSIPGRHNHSNACAALAVIKALDLDVGQAKEILHGFTGIKRRLETVGTENGVTVIDDFAHNPDKLTASLASLKETSGRLLVLFQPHGYGMLKLTGAAMGDVFARHFDQDDLLFLTQPLYLGGTVDKSVGPDVIAERCQARIFSNKESALPTILAAARPGDRIVVMGARDDTLSAYALQLLDGLASKKQESP